MTVDHEAVAKALLGARWVFAKTMPGNPHWWTERKSWAADVTFDEAVMFIRQNGNRLMFGGRPYTCLDVGPHRYWTMGSPLDQTWIINRAINKPGRDRQE